MSIELMMPSNHLILCHPLLLLLSIFPITRIFFQRISSSHQNTGLQFNISPSNAYSGLISVRINWLDLLSVQGILRSLLHHHSLKVSILWHSDFFTVQLSHLYIITGKTIALTRQTFVGKVMSLLFNMLSKLVITFLPRSKHLSPWHKKMLTPWNESYDQLRQHVKKQRHYFANKGLSSQGYGFSSNYV